MSIRRVIVSIVAGVGVLAAPAIPSSAAGSHPAAAEPSRTADPTVPIPQRRVATPHYTGRVVVKLTEPADAPAPDVATHADRVQQAAEVVGAIGVSIAAPGGTATGGTVVEVAGDPVATARRIAAHPGVDYAVPERRLHPVAVPDDPSYPQQWSLAAIGVPQAWVQARGAGVTVAVIDTGSLPHPDLAAQYLPGYDFISDPAVALDGSGRDADATDAGDWTPYGVCEDPAAQRSSWHGLHVAGTIAALVGNGIGVAGIAPASRILPVRALGRCGGTDTDITDALVWSAGGVVPGVPPNKTPAKIINLSLSGPGSCSPMEQRAIDQVNSLGALVVVAAGNDGAEVSGYTPASCRGVLVVGASGSTGRAAQYANSGEAVTLSAPGSAIASLANTGVRAVDASGWTVLTRSGTSMAAPHVSAVAALVWSRSPQLSAAQVRSILVATATPFAVPTSGFGVGIVNAANAVDAVDPPTNPGLPRPVVRSISPAVARTSGGDRITITGSGLKGASVLIGGRSADGVFGDATTLVVTAPAGAVGATQLVVSTDGGSVVLPFGYDARYVVRRSGLGSKLTPQP